MSSVRLIYRQLFIPKSNDLIRRTIIHRTYTTEPQSDGEKYLHNKLTEKFQPTRLSVQDISGFNCEILGLTGLLGGCGSMYSIDIASKAFEGLPIVKQHRMINEYLAEDIRKMHGIQLKTSVE
ncbi:1470_t:CDS:2 [Paraglomus occultum]|uniref:1470_t:CDS:1 n=1 Tax=Paraglomus occultum TaxID=144539 RepID=A0A9N8W265_9GLOM|nr:1470_t:CDS:2 [Paraglomus occultum]